MNNFYCVTRLELCNSLGETKNSTDEINYVWTEGSSLGVFFYDVNSVKDRAIRGMRPWPNSHGLLNTSRIRLDGSLLDNVSSV